MKWIANEAEEIKTVVCPVERCRGQSGIPFQNDNFIQSELSQKSQDCLKLTKIVENEVTLSQNHHKSAHNGLKMSWQLSESMKNVVLKRYAPVLTLPLAGP